MTKKWGILQVAMACACLQAAPAWAGTTDTGPGCGLGKLAWADYPHPKNIAPQVMMATTNATGFNTIAISFGTSGCTNDGKVMTEHKVTLFAAVNFENLSQEMAQGRGEHLASLATLMGLPPEHHPEFFALVQEHYTTLIQSGETTPSAMLNALNAAMASDPALLAKVSANR